MMIQELSKPDVSRYVSGDASEGEFRWGQYLTATPLLTGALAIAQREAEGGDCVSCYEIHELLSAFLEAMDQAGKALYGLPHARRKSDQEMIEENIRKPVSRLVVPSAKTKKTSKAKKAA